MRPPPHPQDMAVSIQSHNPLLLQRLTEQQCHLQDITPPKLADDNSTHFMKSTPSTTLPILKTPPRDPKKEGWAFDDAASKASSEIRDYEHVADCTDDEFGSNSSSASQVSDTDESLGTSISSKSRGPRRHLDDQSPRERREYRKKYYLEPDACVTKGQEPFFESYGGSTRPYVPDVPRGEPGFDPVTAAYQAGKGHARGFSDVVKWLEAEEHIER